jgi:hypothetical protein
VRLAVVALLICFACAAPRTAQPRTVAFNPAEYAGLPTTGTGSIKGQAFMRTLGGEVRYAAGLEILLRPKTAYMEEWFQRSVVKLELLTQSDPGAFAHDRKTVGDGEGHFAFTGIPAGSYYVCSAITWTVPGPNGLQSTGGWVGIEVALAEGQALDNVVVTR